MARNLPEKVWVNSSLKQGGEWGWGTNSYGIVVVTDAVTVFIYFDFFFPIEFYLGNRAWSFSWLSNVHNKCSLQKKKIFGNKFTVTQTILRPEAYMLQAMCTANTSRDMETGTEIQMLGRGPLPGCMPLMLYIQFLAARLLRWAMEHCLSWSLGNRPPSCRSHFQRGELSSYLTNLSVSGWAEEVIAFCGLNCLTGSHFA